jgi:hypothetical protein
MEISVLFSDGDLPKKELMNTWLGVTRSGAANALQFKVGPSYGSISGKPTGKPAGLGGSC